MWHSRTSVSSLKLSDCYSSRQNVIQGLLPTQSACTIQGEILQNHQQHLLLLWSPQGNLSIPQLAVYTTYTVYCLLGDYISPIPPIKGTSFTPIDDTVLPGFFFHHGDLPPMNSRCVRSVNVPLVVRNHHSQGPPPVNPEESGNVITGEVTRDPKTNSKNHCPWTKGPSQ